MTAFLVLFGLIFLPILVIILAAGAAYTVGCALSDRYGWIVGVVGLWAVLAAFIAAALLLIHQVKP